MNATVVIVQATGLEIVLMTAMVVVAVSADQVDEAFLLPVGDEGNRLFS